MDEQNCISEQNWLKYSVGELNADELHLLNSHCQNCEICLDMKEGIDAMKSPTALESQIINIKKQIDQKTNKRFVLFNLTTISIAASILFGLLLFWFLFPSQNQIALKPETMNPQSESGIKSPEESSIVLQNQAKIENDIKSKRRIKKVVPEQIYSVPTEVSVQNDLITESVSSMDEPISLQQIPVEQNQTESDLDKVESKSTQATATGILNEQSISGMNKESAPEPAQPTRKSKSLFEPSTKKLSIPSANNASNNNVFLNEDIRDLNQIKFKDDNLKVLQQAENLFNVSNFSQSLIICDSMMNIPDKPYFTRFVLLKTKILVSNSGKEKARGFLEEQIKKHKLRDKNLLDYLKVLKD